MTEADKPRFAQIMAGLAEVYNATVSTAGLQVRFAALQDFTIDQVDAACVACLRLRRFSTMPTVGEIIDFIGGGRVEDRAEVEAAKVWQAVTRFGHVRDIVFDDETTMAVIAFGFGGWIKMCGELLVEKQGLFIRDFSRLYGAYARQGIIYTGKLIGSASNDSPVLVGDRSKAMAVLNAPVEARRIGNPMPISALLTLEGEFQHVD